MEQEKNKNGVNLLLIVIIVILVVLCVLFATGTINHSINSTKTNENGENTITENEVDSAIVNYLYEVLGINWESGGDCLSYLLSNNDYKSNAQIIFSSYAGKKHLGTERRNHYNCGTECQQQLSCAECVSIFKTDAEQIKKLYGFDNLSFKELSGIESDYVFSTGMPAGACHYKVEHDPSCQYVDANTIKVIDNQVATDYVFGEETVNSTKNQTVAYIFSKDSNGNYYLDSVTVK